MLKSIPLDGDFSLNTSVRSGSGEIMCDIQDRRELGGEVHSTDDRSQLEGKDRPTLSGKASKERNGFCAVIS